MIYNNKKAYSVSLFGFFFLLMFIAVIFFFGTFVMHYLLYDYGMLEIVGVSELLLNSEGTALENIKVLASGYANLAVFYDILFLVLIVSAFIESTMAALKMKESGYLSFFGFVTLGNVFLIYIMSYGVQIQGWLLNEIIYEIMIITLETPFITMFFNYGVYIGVIWYLWLLVVNQMDFGGIKQKFDTVFTRKKLGDEDFSDIEGRFEE